LRLVHLMQTMPEQNNLLFAYSADTLDQLDHRYIAD
jgi:hypothetical protein